MQLLTEQLENLRSEFHALVEASIPREQRTVREFAEQEIVCPPGGPLADEDFTIEAQPFAGLLFDAIDSGLFPRVAVTGPLQSGKTFLLIIVALYHLFEVGENVIYGVPTMDMGMDKWRKDFLPVIMASRYSDMLPTSGAGSEGGKFESITFKNGKTLKFMSAKGGDEKRSGVTSRVLIMTEIDKYDEAGESSRESDPVTQMIGRLEAFELTNSVVYMECSVSIKTGRIWVEFNAGTASRIATPCPHCQSYVTLEREHLRGWQQAENEVQARDLAHFVCPDCDEKWSEDDRIAANKRCILIHKGQTVTKDGVIEGDAPPTFTLGFRWNSSNNLLKSANDLGWKEFKARVDPDEENSERTLLQFTWAQPWNGESNATGITPEIVASRLTGIIQFLVPEDTEVLVVQIDMHFKWHYYSIMAAGRNKTPGWKPGMLTPSGSPAPRFMKPHFSIVDYGVVWNPDRKVLGPEGAMEAGLELLGEDLENREYLTDGGRVVDLNMGTIDAGFHQDIALKFATSANSIWMLAKGLGRKDAKGITKYAPPKAATEDLRPGEHWYYSRQPACKASNHKKWWLLFNDTGHWMHSVHAGFVATPFLNIKDEEGQFLRRPGSIALFGDDPHFHSRNRDSMVTRSNIAQQICGWIWSETKSKKGGTQIGWNDPYPEDHWLDTTYGNRSAVTVVYRYDKRFQPKIIEKKADPVPQFTSPSGEAYLVTNR
jgi:hypothetical protein